MTSLFFSRIAHLPIAHVTQLMHAPWRTTPDFFIVPDVATELTRPNSGGLCHLICRSATCVWDQSSWHWWAATASTACVVQLGAVAHWWCSWPMANTLACLCSCQRQTFWTYFVTISLSSRYLMNFMFHTMLDAAGDVLRGHYTSMKCDVSFSQVSISMIFRWSGNFSYMYKNFILLTTVQKL